LNEASRRVGFAAAGNLTISGRFRFRVDLASALCNDLTAFEKGTPFERKGRKATGLRAKPMTAGLPMRIHRYSLSEQGPVTAPLLACPRNAGGCFLVPIFDRSVDPALEHRDGRQSGQTS
jgi:hypothetical protein